MKYIITPTCKATTSKSQQVTPQTRKKKKHEALQSSFVTDYINICPTLYDNQIQNDISYSQQLQTHLVSAYNIAAKKNLLLILTQFISVKSKYPSNTSNNCMFKARKNHQLTLLKQE